MSKSDPTAGHNFLGATIVAAALFVAAIAGSLPAQAAGACALVPNDKTPSEKTLQCGGAETLTVRVAPGTRYRMMYTKGDPVPAAIRLDDGALLIEFQQSLWRQDFQILTPLAVAAVRGTKWAVEVAKARTSVLVLSDSVGVTNRRLNQYVILTEGRGSILLRPTHPRSRNGGGKPGCGPFFRVSASECRPNARDLPGS